MSQSTLIKPKEKEVTKEISISVCSVCGNEDLFWSIFQRDKCKDCWKKDFEGKFVDGDLNKDGYSILLDGNYKFYSETTGYEMISKDKVLCVFGSIFGGNDLFGFCIQTCDEWGIFKSCFGVTNGFAEFLIKELNLKKEKDVESVSIDIDGESNEISYKWYNHKIIPDEKGKKIFEFEKEIKLKKEELNKELLKLEEMKNANIIRRIQKTC